MSAFYIVVFGLCMIIIGRIMLGGWFNHLTLYSLIWTFTLFLNSLRLIKYKPIIIEAWILIFTAWISLYLGTAVVVLCKKIYSMPEENNHKKNEAELCGSAYYIRMLGVTIAIFCLLGFIGIITLYYDLIKIFKNIFIALGYAGILYQLRVEGIVGGMPYLSSFLYSASWLAGVYTAIRRRINLLTILPLLLIAIHAFLMMARWGALMGAFLFLVAYLYSSKYLNPKATRVIKRKMLIPVIIAILLALFVSEQVRLLRGVIESFKTYGGTETIEKLRNVPFFSPSIYFYLSGNPVVLSEYLKKGGEKNFPGSYTFAPLYRFLAKFDIISRPSYYQPFYYTPVPMNTGTYIREIHADFGEAGVLLFPFFIGLLCGAIFLASTLRMSNLLILAYANLIIFTSFVVNAMSLGYLIISFFLSLGTLLVIKHYARKKLTEKIIAK